MRRAATAALCAALLATLAGAAQVSAGAPDRGRPLFRLTAQRSAAPACVAWKKHHRRVVKRVRRGGEWKRVVRVKRWRTCARRAEMPVVAPPAVTPPTAAPSPQPEPEDPSIPRLGVKAEEWSYTLSRPELEAGEVVVELNNQGEDPHNLNLQLADESGPELSLATIGPSGQSKGKFTLPTGEYRLWCSLDEHETKGMSATLVVAP
jgi:plastocyanin